MSDLIKREDAIEAIKGNNFGYPGDYTEINGEAAIDDIMSLPSAELKGEWVGDCAFVDEFGQPYVVDRCNQCGYCGYADMNYCPNCGARMKGAEDE